MTDVKDNREIQEETGQLFSRERARGLKRRVIEQDSERGQRLAGGLFYQMNELHSKDFFPRKDIEQLLIEQKCIELEKAGDRSSLPVGIPIFSPSSASKCCREQFLKVMKAHKEQEDRYPYQRRWTRNGSAIHEATQRDLLYSEVLLENPIFKVKRLENSLPAWESNIKNCKTLTHNGETFGLNGMMDGILVNTHDNSEVGFEFKTKSTTIASVGTFKLREAQADHKTQCTAYSLLFGMDEFILMYESLAKDGWTKGKEARSDLRTFYVYVDEEQKLELLDKWASVAKAVREKRVPAGDTSKCIFCPYKRACKDLKEGELYVKE